MGGRNPQRFSAQKKTEVVLRLLRGEALDLLSRELGITAACITSWREAFLDAGQEAMKKPDSATVGGRVTSPTAVPKPGLKVSLHPAPQ
jgi:transposase-like protein